MPVLSWAHSQYWQGTTPAAAPAGSSPLNGYIPWMPNIISVCGLLLFVWLGA